MLHTWGSALTHHPHIHVIVPGGGLSPDGSRWIACKPGFFLPVRVLSRLFRRLFLDGLSALNQAGRLAFRGDLAPLADKRAFDAALAPLRRSAWRCLAERKLRLRVRQYGERYLWFESISLTMQSRQTEVVSPPIRDLPDRAAAGSAGLDQG